jgi:hypothetical protein
MIAEIHYIFRIEAKNIRNSKTPTNYNIII